MGKASGVPPDESERPSQQGPPRLGLPRCGDPAGGCCSEHPHLSLRPEHDLLIRGQDQGLGAGHEVRLGADVALAIKEQHPQQLAGCIKQMHRDDADGAAGP